MASSRKTKPGKSPPNLPEALTQWWHRQWPEDAENRPTSVLIAYSGGVDSTALLHAMARAKKITPTIGVPIRAVHFNHQLQPLADTWQAHCELTAQALGVPLTVIPLSLKDASEHTARQARYAALKALLRPDELLLTAHHRDDQAETVLQQLLRGSGLTGLGGIRPLQAFASGWLARPLLRWSKQQLYDWLLAEEIPWVSDPSNRDTRYRRNFLRHRVLPTLMEHWPQAPKALSRAAEHAQAAESLLQHFYRRHGPATGAPLPLSSFSELPETAHGTWLGLWLADHGQKRPDSARVQEFLIQCQRAAADHNPQLDLGNGRIIRWRDALYLVENKSNDTAEDFSHWTKCWDGTGSLRLPAALGSLELTELTGSSENRPLRLQVGFYRGGESIRLPQHRHSKRLKNLFQEHAVPPWERRRLPLIFATDAKGKADTLLAVGDRWLAEGAPFRGVLWHRQSTRSATA